MMLLLIFLPHLFIVTSSLSIARPLAWLALAITVFLSLALLSLLVWPSAFGRFALRLELTRFGSWVGGCSNGTTGARPSIGSVSGFRPASASFGEKKSPS